MAINLFYYNKHNQYIIFAAETPEVIEASEPEIKVETPKKQTKKKSSYQVILRCLVLWKATSFIRYLPLPQSWRKI